MKSWKPLVGCGMGLAAMLELACGSSANKSTVAPPGAVDINGFTYTEIYTCNETHTGSATVCADNQVSDVIEFTSTGASTYVGRDVPDTGFVYTATMSGLVLTWSAVSPDGYTETGTWTFSADGSTFSGSSNYVADDATYNGRCNTNGAKVPGVPPAPLPVAPCM